MDKKDKLSVKNIRNFTIKYNAIPQSYPSISYTFPIVKYKGNVAKKLQLFKFNLH